MKLTLQTKNWSMFWINWSLLLRKTTWSCTYLYAEDLVNTILFMMHHKIPLHVPFIIFFEKSSGSHSGGLQICVQCCVVLYSYKKNNSTFFTEHGCLWSHSYAQHCSDQAFQTTLNISCFSYLAKHRAVSKWKYFLLCFPKQSNRFRSWYKFWSAGSTLNDNQSSLHCRYLSLQLRQEASQQGQDYSR